MSRPPRASRSAAVRIAARSAGVLAVLLAIAVAALWLAARSRLPRVSGRTRLAGLVAPVTVRRDRLGVPHIDAGSALDGWTAMGFVHAQDRFFQMELLRRSAAGRLAEVVGERALPLDREHRRLGLARTATAELAVLAAAERAALEAYARGVNAGLADTGRPLECVLLRYVPEPWAPLDSLLVLKWMEELLASDGGERTRADLTAKLGAETAAFLFDFQGLRSSTILPASPGATGPPASAPTPPAGSHPPPDEPAAVPGSNAWVLAGSRTASGRPLLANDTHLPVALPSAFYQAHLRFPGGEVAGMTLPGAPFVVVGHNAHVAWGVTVLMADQIDFVDLTLDPSDPFQFRRGELDWERLERIEEVIRVRDRPSETLIVKWSHFGPVVEESGYHATARRWTVYGGDRSVRAVHAFQTAASVAQLFAAARDLTDPGLSVVAADAAGHIGWFPAAQVPYRGPERGDGRLPSDGAARPFPPRGPACLGDRETNLPPAAHLALLDPPAGAIVSANHAIGSGADALRIATWWALPFRADRIHELLTEIPVHDVASEERVQGDARSLYARRLLRALPDVPLRDEETDRWWRRLKAWDGSYLIGPEPAVFEVFQRTLRRDVFEDEAGPLWVHATLGLLKVTGAGIFDGVPPSLAARDWADDVRTPEHETLGDQVEHALAATLDRLRQDFGTRESGWSWERVHQVHFIHPLLHGVPVVGRLFDLVPVAVRGSAETVCANAGSVRERFRVNHIPAFRMVVDLGDFRRSRIVNSTGQSGHPLSRHYGDQVATWAEARSYPWLWAEEDIARETEATLVLTP